MGLTGLLLAGLLAAFMSTFAGTLNAAQAYILNDIYLKYYNPEASNVKVRNMSYMIGVSVVLISIIFGIFAENVNSMLQWIVSALYGSYVASNVLKWYWWRFNAYGYFWGMATGLVFALLMPELFPNTLELYLFPGLLLVSLGGSIGGALLTPATDMETLKSFYKNIKPWGYWGPVREEVEKEIPGFGKNTNAKRDWLNVIIGTITQMVLVVLPIYVVLMQLVPTLVSLLILVVCGYMLKIWWYDKIEEYPLGSQEIKETEVQSDPS